ncbi:oxidoreductase [Mycobacterium dioxanotrophicus]|jgi:nitroreductase|uniref:Oxidoreductase n=1 Tax=Mycobacterium dioxanotrophicus TaxID=482462 RepID=A0A1Y0CAZ7_9MYCO|nr:nitroreductase [Mycobacterium dioxanotrophicus]ART72413.1 oxidoreductase [Mycobacterium dioxanotrophicus]
MHDLEAAILARHSTRLFRPNKPVPRQLVDEALELAIHAPSNSNVQPWQVVFTTGPARDRLVKALLAEAQATDPQIPPLPAQFEHYRRDVGKLVYGAMGIARADVAARRLAVLRNWEFFGAPLAGVVCMHRELGHADSLGVGMFLQTFLLALTARGLDSCVQVSIAGYPEIVREQLGISDDMRIMCGVAVGYGVTDFPANTVRSPRNPVSDNVSYLED